MVKFVRFKHRDIPDRELVRDLRRVARETGRRRVTSILYAEHGAFGPGTLARRFGSWNAALGAAGLPVAQLWKVPDTALLENLADVWRKLGRQPTWRELTKRGGFSKFAGATYKRRFGSWHAALRAFEVFASQGNRRDALPRRPKTIARSSRDISWRLRATVLIRDNCLCRMCGASPAKDPAVTLHVDHIVPWSKGGQTVLGNLQTLCAPCNIGKGDQPPPLPSTVRESPRRPTARVPRRTTKRPRRARPRRSRPPRAGPCA